MPGASSNAGESYWPAAPPPPDRCGKADLAEIWVHIASEAPEAVASPFVAAIEAAFGPVRHFPLAAPAREELALGLRITFHNPYAIYDRPLSDAVVIIRELHGTRDIAALAEHGGFAG